MNLLDVEKVVVVVKHKSAFHWYMSDRELWVLDLPKWTQAFTDAGYEVPEIDASERFGIPVVNEQTMDRFLEEMEQFRIDRSVLSEGLARRFSQAQSWWDVGKLFPMIFVNCDKRHVSAFYSQGVQMERFIPDGWSGEFTDFANNANEEDFPVSERFWIQDGVDMLAVLNERGEKLARNDGGT